MTKGMVAKRRREIRESLKTVEYGTREYLLLQHEALTIETIITGYKLARMQAKIYA